MKTKNLLIAFTLLSLAFFLVFTGQSCKKDENEQPKPENPPTYTNGQGEIGSIGGTVMVDDPDSPLDGAKVVVPKGATDKEITVTIQEPDENYDVPGYGNPLMIQCSPEGQVFSKAVELYIPYEGNATMAYYFDSEQGIIEQLEVLEIDQSNKLIKTQVDHFSLYFAGEENIAIDLELVKSNGQFAAYGVLLDDLEDIPTHWMVTQYNNAYDVAENDPNENVARFRFGLYRKLSFGLSEPVAYKAYYVYWYEYTDLLRVEESYNVVHQDAPGHNQFFSIEVESVDTRINTWMRGLPLLMIFDEDSFLEDNFTYEDDDEFFVGCNWGLNEPWNPVLASHRWTAGYSFGSRGSAKTWNELNEFTEDSNNNGIFDNYEGGGSNQPPNDPTNESPDDGATNVSINTNLSWTCTDPDGDELDYDIYFGTSSNPPLEEEYYTSTSWDPGTLDENTTYYWKIKAFEVGNDDHYSESPVWEFTTGDGGGGSSGTFIDPRDGHEYEYVEIGFQTWMAENLNYETGNSWCYDNDPANCETYGRLYDWETAMNACPPGWHLPSYLEWEILIFNQGGEDIAGGKLKEEGFEYWNAPNTGATNESGFTALPGGYMDSNDAFNFIYNRGYFWCADEETSSRAISYYLGYNLSYITSVDFLKQYGFSIRCIKN